VSHNTPYPPAGETDDRVLPYGILPDWAIRRYVPITPLEEGVERPGKISWGLSSYGYDCRIGYRFKVFSPVFCQEVDPKAPHPRSFQDVDLTPTVWEEPLPGGGKARRLIYPNGEDFVRIPPNCYALGESVEHFAVPPDVQCVCVGKSTYARAGIIVNVTPLEPAWRGRVTIEVSNSTPLPVRLYAGEGVCQVLFFRGAPCDRTYADKKAGGPGKYQDQTGLVLGKVD
jgi:dCTP deaminase